MHIALCTPCYDGRVHDAHMASVVKTMRKAAEKGIQITLITGRGSPILPDIRNWCVAMAMSYGCDKVWFVDSDIAWEHSIDETLNMLMAPVDVVAGVHQKRNTTWNGPAELVVTWKQIPPVEDAESGLWEVARVATAFVCIDRSVFERMADAGVARRYLPHGKLDPGAYNKHLPFYRNYYWYDFEPVDPPTESKDLLQALGWGDDPLEMLRGEDFYFCNQIQKLGCKIFVDPRIRLAHFDGCVQHTVCLEDVKFEAAQ